MGNWIVCQTESFTLDAIVTSKTNSKSYFIVFTFLMSFEHCMIEVDFTSLTLEHWTTSKFSSLVKSYLQSVIDLSWRRIQLPSDFWYFLIGCLNWVASKADLLSKIIQNIQTLSLYSKFISSVSIIHKS